MKKLICSLFVLICAIVCLTMPAYAVDKVNSSSIQAHYLIDNKPIEGIEFELHHVGFFDNTETFIWDVEFSDYRLEFDASKSVDTARVLKEYIRRDRVAPLDTVRTDSQGKLCFDNLASGVYLVFGDAHIIDNIIYTPQPVFVMV